MWQSVVRPLLRITSMSKILSLFLAPFSEKVFSSFETLQYFWLRGDTVWLSTRTLQRWGNFLKLATMKVFHEKKSSKPARWKVLSKTFKGLSQMKDWGNGFEYIIAKLFQLSYCVVYVSSWYRPYFAIKEKDQVLAYFLCWIVGSLLINDTLI